MIRWYSGLLLCTALCGCVSLAEMLGFGYVRPEVKLLGIELKSISTDGNVNLLVRLEVRNQNSFAIKLKSVNYALTILGAEVAAGNYQKPFEVGPQAKDVARLPLELRSQELRTVIERVLLANDDKGEVTGILKASVIFDSPVGDLTYDFVDERQIAVK